MAQRPATISLRDLSQAVEQAVKTVSQKHKVQFLPNIRVGPGTLTGRQIDPTADIGLKQVEQIAADITQHIASTATEALGGARLEPAVFIGRGVILSGFLPPEGMLELK